MRGRVSLAGNGLILGMACVFRADSGLGHMLENKWGTDQCFSGKVVQSHDPSRPTWQRSSPMTFDSLCAAPSESVPHWYGRRTQDALRDPDLDIGEPARSAGVGCPEDAAPRSTIRVEAEE
jgi:hypothetical protein